MKATSAVRWRSSRPLDADIERARQGLQGTFIVMGIDRGIAVGLPVMLICWRAVFARAVRRHDNKYELLEWIPGAFRLSRQYEMIWYNG